MSNLRLINETTVSASVSNVDVTNVFSADFDIYKITTSGFTTVSTTSTDLDARFINSSGSVISSSSYDTAHLNLKAETSFSSTRVTNQTLISSIFGGTDDSPEGSGTVTYIFNPFSSSSYTFGLFQVSSNLGGNHRSRKGITVLKSTASITGFRIVGISANVDEGIVRTYGLRVDS
jgi:hypothetical protein